MTEQHRWPNALRLHLYLYVHLYMHVNAVDFDSAYGRVRRLRRLSLLCKRWQHNTGGNGGQLLQRTPAIQIMHTHIVSQIVV